MEQSGITRVEEIRKTSTISIYKHYFYNFSTLKACQSKFPQKRRISEPHCDGTRSGFGCDPSSNGYGYGQSGQSYMPQCPAFFSIFQYLAEMHWMPWGCHGDAMGHRGEDDSNTKDDDGSCWLLRKHIFWDHCQGEMVEFLYT